MPRELLDNDAETVTEEQIKTREPKSFQVILLNDNFTTMEFVIAVLEGIFRKSPAEAMQIMLRVHNHGRGVAGIYSKEIAEAKMGLVHERAKAEGYPLRCIMEEL